MASQDTAALVQQNETLREIRNELRMTRAASTAGGSTAADSVRRPGGTFIASQLVADRAMAGDFANFGWTQAFSPIYRSTLSNDVSGALGLQRSPSTMYQSEFQAIANENLGLRASGLATGMIAPGYTGQINRLSQDIFSHSYRFARFGDPSTSMLGQGVSRTGARQLAHQVSQQAVQDLRLSDADYGDIMNVGMAGGLFDRTRGDSGDFMDKVKEMGAAVGDLTRALRMSARDVTQAMVGLRAVGITDIGAQRDTLMSVAAGAQVAGMSTQEVGGVAQAAAQQGLQAGIGPQAAAQLAVQNLTVARGLTPAGLMTGRQMAMGGGAIGIAQSITQAEQQFASSQQGYLAMLGRHDGARGDMFSQTLGGLDVMTRGGLNGMLQLQMSRTELLGEMDPATMQQAFRESLVTEMQMFGVQDPLSVEGRGFAYNLLRQRGLDDSAALAYTRSNFSEEGRRQQQRQRYLSVAAERTMERKNMADQQFFEDSFAGRFQKAKAAGIGYLRGWGQSIENAFTTGQSGGPLWTAGNIEMSMRQADAGVLNERGDITAMAAAWGGLDISTTDYDRIRLNNGRMAGTGAAIGAAGGMLAGAATGMAIGGLAGFGVGSIPGMVIGGGLGLAGGWLGSMVGTSAEAAFSSSEAARTLSGADAKNYMQLLQAQQSGVNAQRGRSLIQKHQSELQGNAMFRNLITNADRTDLSLGQSKQLASDIGTFAGDLGVSRAEALDILAGSGMSVELLGAAGSTSGGGGFDRAKLTTRLEELFDGGAADQITTQFATSESMSSLSRYLGSLSASSGKVKAGSEVEFATAQGALADRGVSAEQLAALRSNYAGMSVANRKELMTQLRAGEGNAASRAIRRHLATAGEFADMVLGDAGRMGDGRASTARGQLQSIMDDDPRRLLQALEGGGALGEILRENPLFSDVANVASASELRGMSSRELARRYSGVFQSEQDAENFRSQMVGEGGDASKSRRALQLQLLSAGNIEASGEFEEADRSAKILKDAAEILKGLTSKLGITPTA